MGKKFATLATLAERRGLLNRAAETTTSGAEQAASIERPRPARRGRYRRRH